VSTKPFDEFNGAIRGGVVEINPAFVSGPEVAGVSFIGEGFKFPDRSMFGGAFPIVG
jgi:hypothetical protein